MSFSFDSGLLEDYYRQVDNPISREERDDRGSRKRTSPEIRTRKRTRKGISRASSRRRRRLSCILPHRASHACSLFCPSRVSSRRGEESSARQVLRRARKSLSLLHDLQTEATRLCPSPFSYENQTDSLTRGERSPRKKFGAPLSRHRAEKFERNVARREIAISPCGFEKYLPAGSGLVPAPAAL